jgi:single-stranded-DNA-specific exonuclease
VPGLNLHEAIQECAPSLIRFGGHAAAAGLKLRLEKLRAFRDQFETACRARMATQPKSRALLIDAQVPLSLLSMRVVGGLEELEPYGEGNPRPQLLCEDVRIAAEPRRFGADQNHLRLTLEQGGVCLRGTAWRKAESWGGLRAGQRLDIVFEPRIDRYNGRTEVVLNLIDQRLHDS